MLVTTEERTSSFNEKEMIIQFYSIVNTEDRFQGIGYRGNERRMELHYT